MQNPDRQYKLPYYEYKYSHSDAISFCHHTYLLPPLLEMISWQRNNSSCKLRVLDLGCGDGTLSQKIAQQGYEVVGVEESLSGITSARRNISECKFIQASIYDLPYADLGETFDIVIAAEVIEHLLYPRELVRASKRCLKPGGRIIVTTPYHGYLKNLVLSLVGKLDQHFTVLWDGGHIKFFSVETLTQLLQEEGQKNIKFKFAGRLPFLWKSMLCSSIVNKN